MNGLRGARRQVRKALYIAGGLFAFSCLVAFLNRPEISEYSQDDWWWEGVVVRKYESIDGIQDFISKEGYYLILRDGLPIMKGDPFFVLNAKSPEGLEMTFLCKDKNRDMCKPISSIVRFPKATHTKSQGALPPKP